MKDKKISVDEAITGRGTIKHINLNNYLWYELGVEDVFYRGNERIVNRIHISECEKYVIIGFDDDEVYKIPMTSVIFFVLK